MYARIFQLQAKDRRQRNSFTTAAAICGTTDKIRFYGCMWPTSGAYFIVISLPRITIHLYMHTYIFIYTDIFMYYISAYILMLSCATTCFQLLSFFLFFFLFCFLLLFLLLCCVDCACFLCDVCYIAGSALVIVCCILFSLVVYAGRVYACLPRICYNPAM